MPAYPVFLVSLPPQGCSVGSGRERRQQCRAHGAVDVKGAHDAVACGTVIMGCSGATIMCIKTSSVAVRG